MSYARMLTKSKLTIVRLNQHRKYKLKLLEIPQNGFLHFFYVTIFISQQDSGLRKEKGLDLRRNFIKWLQSFPEFLSVIALSTDWIIPESVIHVFGTAHLNHNKNRKML